MNRRLFRNWARWLLPLLAVRAFLPVGFMLAVNGDGMQLAFCPDQVRVVQGMDHAAQAGHGGAAHDGSQHGGHLDPPCPYALAAVAAVIDIPYLDSVALQAAERLVPERVVAVPLAGPQRADRIRGPPALS